MIQSRLLAPVFLAALQMVQSWEPPSCFFALLFQSGAFGSFLQLILHSVRSFLLALPGWLFPGRSSVPILSALVLVFTPLLNRWCCSALDRVPDLARMILCWLAPPS